MLCPVIRLKFCLMTLSMLQMAPRLTARPTMVTRAIASDVSELIGVFLLLMLVIDVLGTRWVDIEDHHLCVHGRQPCNNRAPFPPFFRQATPPSST